VLAWQWLQDADLAVNARGAAAGGVLALAVLVAALGWRALQAAMARRTRRASGARGRQSSSSAHLPGLWLLAGAYAAVLLALAVGSVAGVWRFPALWPDALTAQAWLSVWASLDTVGTTLGLALVSTALALAWCVAWLELSPRAWDNALRPLLYLPLVLPAVFWVVGLYSVALQWRLEGQWLGLLLAHTVMVLPYVLLALSPAYLGFDPRAAQLSDSLGHSRLVFLWRVKWPLLRRSLAASAAVGFAVSVTQYLPTLYIGAGRFATVTTEAVNLAAGAQRSLTSAYAGLQFLLPVLAFALAAWIGRPRRFRVASA
jgi:putative thiamine transport system permease protein